MSELFWQYDSDGKLIDGVQETAVDPVASKRAGHFVFFPIPKNGVTVEPPKKKDAADIYWKDGAWVYVEKPKPEEPPTEAEIWASLSTEEKASRIRSERDSRIDEVIWRVQRYDQQTKLGIATTDSAEQYHAVLAYIEALREVPEQGGFPDTVEWPSQP